MINSNFGFTPLKEVWLGDTYPESFYDNLPNEVADPLCQITQWCQEDIGKLQKFLEGRGIKVRRPQFDSIEDHLGKNDQLVKPPITPRDHYLVLDKTLYSLHHNEELKRDRWHHVMDEYKQLGYDVQQPKHLPINCMAPPSIVRIGKDIYVDPDAHEKMWGFCCQAMVELAKKYRVNICSTGGHSDGIFTPIAPNVIGSSHWKTDYSVSFPDWEVFSCPMPKELNNFIPYQNKNWSIPGTHDKNEEFSKWIAADASDWIGEFQETVFEVNMLVLDEKNVVAMKDHPPLTEWLDKQGITLHTFDFRPRSFFDGGWHCLTLDIHREDTLTDLFPERGDNGVYYREDMG
jgi:hypothetical protein